MLPSQLIALVSGIMSLLIAIFAGIVVYQLRAVRRKNAILSQEIAENAEYKAKYLRLMSHPEVTTRQKDEESLPLLGTMSDAELFEFLRVVIVGEQLYLDPDFDRSLLMNRFHLNKNRIGAAFAIGSPYGSLTAYIGECRLKHGAHLLAVHPEMSVAEIATACGYSNASIFTRNFKQRYALTPSEFRAQER